MSDDLQRIDGAASRFVEPGEELIGILPTAPSDGARMYVCAFTARDGTRAWLALDESGEPVLSRVGVREAVAIAALCEVAEDTAAGGDLDELRARLVALRLTENPPGIDEAEEAVLALQRAIGSPPRVASPAHLDAVGSATRRLEQALGDEAVSPFAESMKLAMQAVETLAREVEGNYKRPLSA